MTGSKIHYKWLIISLLTIVSQVVFAQSYTIKGQIIDNDTEEGVPFANVYLQKTSTGIATDINGFYSIATNDINDTLVVSAVGFQTEKRALEDIPTQEINIRISPSNLQLSEITVYAGENPANIIVRNIIKNKKRHNFNEKESYECERYSKVELDLHNFDDALFEKKTLKPFQFILDNIDSTTDEKTFLPAYINENVDNLFFIKKRPLRVVPRATRTSGIDASTVVRQVQRLHQPYNIYENWIPVLEKNFASPFSDLGFFYYEYYIMDSTVIDNQWAYNLKFKPKRKQENTFYGDFWVADTTFAILRLSMRKMPDVNINLVDRVTIYEEYKWQDSLYLPLKRKMLVDFLPTEKLPGLIARKTDLYKNFLINQPSTEVKYELEDPEDFTLEELKKSDEYWDNARHEVLSDNEKTIYMMIDSIKNTTVFKRYSDVVYTLTTGWLKVGQLETGTYFNIYGGNAVEGNRFQLGLGTNLDFSTKYRGEIFAAYGTKDKKWKYGGKFHYNLKKQPRREFLGAQYFDDVIYSSQSSEDAIAGSSLASFFRRDIPQRLLHSREGKLFYFKEWKRGWSGRLTALNRVVDPYGAVYADGSGFNFQYISPNTGEIDTTVTTTEFIFKIRHAYKEQFWAGHFDRISLGSKYPIYSFQYTAGVKDILGSEYNYHKIALEYSHWIYTNPIGWFRYYFKAGKTFGTLPMLLLEAHNGNETFFYDSNGFNVMNRYEFVSDTYFSWVFVHHFDGYFLNKIPLIRKLDWRSMAHFRGVWGTLTDANKTANALNTSDVGGTIPFRSPFPAPYMEAGVGIENIFKVLHVQAIWRLNYLDNPEAYHFMVQAGIYFNF